MRFKNAARPLPEIAQALNVEAVVEGSVLRSGQRVRITAQLIDAATDRHLWADRFERDLRDVLAIQNEAARAIARAVRVQLTREDAARLSRPEEVMPEAYQDLLLGRFYFNKRTGDGLEKSIPYFRSAIAKSPAYAAAYTGLAEAYDLLPLYSDILPQESLRNALAAAMKALEIDDGDSDAHAALAFARFHHEWRWDEAEAEFRKAIQINPASALAHHWYAEYLVCRGRFDDALAERRRARGLDPLNLTINSEIAGIHYYARRYDDAIEAARRALELDAAFGLAHDRLGSAYAEKKLYGQAIAEFRRLADLQGGTAWATSSLAYAYAVSGDAARARQVLGRLERPPNGRYVSPPLIADVYAGLGEKGQALDWLEKGVAEGSVWIVYIGVSPRMDSLRAEPRFRDLVRRVGLES